MPETEGRKSLRVRDDEGLEQKMGALEDNGSGNEQVWCREGEGETNIAGLRLWIMDLDLDMDMDMDMDGREGIDFFKIISGVITDN